MWNEAKGRQERALVRSGRGLWCVASYISSVSSPYETSD